MNTVKNPVMNTVMNPVMNPVMKWNLESWNLELVIWNLIKSSNLIKLRIKLWNPNIKSLNHIKSWNHIKFWNPIKSWNLINSWNLVKY